MILDNSTPVWVTGGVSGLGAACVERMEQAGAPVVVFDLAEDTTPREGVTVYNCDVSDADAVSEVVARAASDQATGKPRVLDRKSVV